MTAIEILKLRLEVPTDSDAPTDALLEQLLVAAGEIIVDHRYPFGGYEMDEETGLRVVPEQYKGLMIDIAIELYSKLGAEGQLAHRENGIDRYYATALVSPDMLKRIVPLAKIV